MGDFNSQPWSIPIALLRGYGALRDSFLEAHPSANDPAPPGLSAAAAIETLGMTVDSPLNTWSRGKPIPANVSAAGGKRLDYIFYVPPLRGEAPAIRCASSRVILTEPIPGRDMSYSDHFGLVSTFVLAPGSPNMRAASHAPSQGTSHAPLLDTDSGMETASVALSGPGSVYELARAESAGSTAGAIRAALATLRAYGRLAAKRTRTLEQIVGACILAALALTVGSAWQPKAWIQPVFTLVAFVLGAGGATALYTGWLWGRWERGKLDEVMGEMEMELRVMEEREGR